MRPSPRASLFCILAFSALLFPVTARAQKPAIAEKVAKEFGIDSWGQIEAIRYTFNIDAGPKLHASRAWTWETKTGRVTFEGKDKAGKDTKVSYLISELSSQPAEVQQGVQPGFVNDQYWLIFPFHMIWDSSPEVTDKGKQKLPLGKGTGDLLMVKYPPEAGGFTPGDTWEIYIGDDNRVKVLDFHHGGNAKPSHVLATWEGYKKAGPLLVSTEHRGTVDGNPFHLSFTNVAVKLTGSDSWVEAK
jgi:hypothetical protein